MSAVVQFSLEIIQQSDEVSLADTQTLHLGDNLFINLRPDSLFPQIHSGTFWAVKRVCLPELLKLLLLSNPWLKLTLTVKNW